jgi:hypothetical protein
LFISQTVNGKNEIIYKINKDGFVNSLTKELDVPQDLYGFQFSSLGDDYLKIHAVQNGGAVSDDIIVRWYPDKKVFGISPNSQDEMSSVLIHTFKSTNGSALAKAYADYNGAGSVATLHLVIDSGGKQKEIYQINANGFYNTIVSKQDLAISSNSFYGYEVVKMGDDYFVRPAGHVRTPNAFSARNVIHQYWEPGFAARGCAPAKFTTAGQSR